MLTDKILSKKTLDKVIEMNPNKGQNKAAYVYASENLELVANEFYKNFKKNASKKLKQEFENFKKENAFWLDKDALYEALSIENKSDYWPQWKNELDRTLFNAKDAKKAGGAWLITLVDLILSIAELGLGLSGGADGSLFIGCGIAIVLNLIAFIAANNVKKQGKNV